MASQHLQSAGGCFTLDVPTATFLAESPQACGGWVGVADPCLEVGVQGSWEEFVPIKAGVGSSQLLPARSPAQGR